MICDDRVRDSVSTALLFGRGWSLIIGPFPDAEVSFSRHRSLFVYSGMRECDDRSLSRCRGLFACVQASFAGLFSESRAFHCRK